ncbi:MAG: adaptor protein MecA [Roseburia sp.]|nr:adaptor protein MecA [Roseburia sp.]
MKIEKINENQIRCTLTKQDLAERQIKLSELAYGTEKVKMLFRDMMQQAAYEFGFEAEDVPLMIEAIPLSADTIILVVTKVEYPEELDTRFSKFSNPDPEYMEEDMLLTDSQNPPIEGADDILGLFKKIQEERKKLLEKQKQDSFIPLKELKKKTEEETSVQVFVDITKLYVFQSLEEVSRVAGVLKGFYAGRNDLYKNAVTHKYYLLVSKSSETPEKFNKVCNILSEYAVQQTYTPGTEAFLKEHYQVLLAGNALQTLAEL